MPSIGSRVRQNFRKEHTEGGRLDRSYTRDQGLLKNVTASMTFVGAPTNQIQAAANTFVNFAAEDIILVAGSVLNSGVFKVLSTDASTQLTVDPGLKAEGPIQCTVRTQ